MRKFTTIICSLALLFGAVGEVKAEKKYADLSKLATVGGTNATWDGATNTISWTASSNNLISNFDFGFTEPYDVSGWSTITVTITSLTGSGIRLQMKADDKESNPFELTSVGSHTYNLSDFTVRWTTDKCDIKKVNFLRILGLGDAGSAVISEVYLERPDDPLAIPKDNLNSTINLGKSCNSFAKTTDSWNALQTAISNGEKEYASASATAESLAAAKKAIEDAIAGLKLEDGYANLAAGMFKSWDDNYVPTTSSNVGCAYALNESTGQPYGDGSVGYLNFADISDFSKLYVLGTAGTPRIMMNRLEVGNGGGDSNGGSYVQIKEAFADGKVEVDLTAYDYAHLNAIKSESWGQVVTVTDMLLYRTLTIGATGYSTFGSINNSAKLNGATVYAATYAGGKVTLDAVTTGIVPAGKGVIVAGSGEIKPTFDVAAADIDTDLKVSNGTVVADGSTIYVLANGTNGLGFYRLQSGDKVPAGKAYLEIASPSREFIGIDGMSTGIQSVATEKADSAIYNLGGQRVANAQKGVYIVNGKKMVIK